MHLDPQKDVEIMEDHGGEDIKQEEIFNNPIFVEGECEDVVKVQLDDTNNAPLDIDVDEHGTANAGSWWTWRFMILRPTQLPSMRSPITFPTMVKTVSAF